MTLPNTWTVNVEEDPETGDLLLPLPQEMLDDLDWKEGDVLQWIDNNDGTFSIKKKDNNA